MQYHTGIRGGVEKLIHDKNPHLLDINGDTAHMVNNVAKVLLSNVDDGMQMLCADLYYDVEESPKVKHIFQEVQVLLNMKTLKYLIRPFSSKFLQMKDVLRHRHWLFLIQSLYTTTFSCLKKRKSNIE